MISAAVRAGQNIYHAITANDLPVSKSTVYRHKIRRHIDAIVATVTHQISNARVEAANNKIKLTIRMAYGFRNIDNLIALIYLRCGGRVIYLPGRATGKVT